MTEKRTLPTIGSLAELASVHQPPCLSLYQPTHRGRPENQQDPIRFHNLVKELETSLRQKYPDVETRRMYRATRPRSRLVRSPRRKKSRLPNPSGCASAVGLVKVKSDRFMRRSAWKSSVNGALRSVFVICRVPVMLGPTWVMEEYRFRR